MKHVSPAMLEQLEGLLRELRALGVLQERSRGVFYLRSKPFLHFHEDPSGLYADVKLGQVFERYPVSSSVQRRALLLAVRQRVTA